MTRDEFMKYAEDEIEIAIGRQKNRIMDVIYRAWAEGKRNAEIAGVSDIVRGALEKMTDREWAKDERTG